ncbi:hypothetical protein CLOM_g18733 [Closterium sp. NIES-68]|nr:hypothetical protein CLOM_g18733 [Closterium sp. NIES-68]GJP74756.1 hypothetical protein CLOP_g5296 [Closterium sp. NIES-67]
MHSVAQHCFVAHRQLTRLLPSSASLSATVRRATALAPARCPHNFREASGLSAQSASALIARGGTRCQSSSSEASAKEEPNVKDLAQKARLALTAEEEEEFGTSISRIVDWFGQLQQVDLSDVPAAIRVGGEELTPGTMREDVARDFDNREGMLSQVPKMDGPFIRVPNVLPSS